MDPRIAIVLSDEHEPKARAALGRVVTCPVYVIDRVGKIVYQTAIPPAATLRDLHPYIVVWIGVGPEAAQRFAGPLRSPVGEPTEDRYVEHRWMRVQTRNAVLTAIRAAEADVDAVEQRHRAAARAAQRERSRAAGATLREAVLAARRRERDTVWLFIPAGMS